MITRRHFIGNLSKASIALAVNGKLDKLVNKREHTIGLLLGTVESYMTQNADDTLKKVAAIGYKELEYPRTYGYTTDSLKAIIKSHKLTSLGGGDNISNLTRYFDEVAKEYNQMGKKYVFCYWPWFDDGKNKTVDDWKRQTDVFNKLGAKFKYEGLRLAYHNHNIEFIETEGQIPYSILLNNIDPELATFQMDIWWVKKGGKEPLDFIADFPGRFEVCHIKPAGLIEGNEEVKNLNYKKVLTQSSKAGFKHFILENEPGIADPFGYFRDSYNLLKEYLADL